MNKVELFSTPIWIHDFSDEASREILEKLANLALDEERGAERQQEGKSNRGNSFHTQTNFLGDFRQTPLFSLLAPRLAAALADYGYNTSGVRVNYWSIVSRHGGYNRRHNHPDAVLSVAFYVRVPQGSGRLIFADPRYGKLMESQFGRSSASSSLHGHITVEPKFGRLVIFPSFLEHEVEMSTCEAPRVIYSLNIQVL